MAKNEKPVSHGVRGNMGLMLVPLLLGLFTSVLNAAEPAQSPLISRSGSLPPPNFMVTLDTSWSMIFPYMPEATVTVNGFALNFPSFNSPVMHPNDNRYDKGTGTNPKSQGDGGVILSDPDNVDNVRILQYWMRSADVNSIYYNPKKLYLPWITINTDGSTGRFPNANPAKAWFNPITTSPDDATTRADLTAAAANVSAQWCLTSRPVAGGKLTCDAAPQSRRFAPGLFYVLKSASVNPNATSSFTKWDVNSGVGFPVAKWSTERTDCGTTCTQAQERQNYANWFVYHRTRLHVAQAALPEAVVGLDNGAIRLGWAAIHSSSPARSVDGVPNVVVVQGVRTLSTALKSSLLTWLRSISSSSATAFTDDPKLAGGTPLRIATAAVGEYFKRTDARSPWANDPALSNGGGAVADQLSCRRSYNMLITDGYYNDVVAANTYNNLDGGLSDPYRDNHPDRLADVAYKYWSDDLNTNLANGVASTTTDSATWQHLSQFMVGLGVYGTYDKDQWKRIKEGTLKPTWWGPTLPADNAADIRKIDDLMHAALNSRGDYFSVKDSSDLVDAVGAALGLATAQRGSESGVATSSPTLSAGNRKYIPEYLSSRWTGSLKAYALDEFGRTVLEDTIDTNNAPLWDASTRVPAHGSRSIYTWDQGGTPGIRPFTWASMSTTNRDLLGTLKSEDFVNFIRGDTTNEGDAGTGLYRVRMGRLPDFVNSPPTLIKGNLDMKYGADITGGASYAAFYAAKNARSGTIFIGGNGGMLHAFRDSDGTEVFGYVPRAVYSKLHHLAEKTYGTATNYHQAYVDGPMTEADAYIVPNGETTKSWRNILMVTLGAGGKSLVALDVTNAPTLNANSVLWELPANNDMGFAMSEAQVGVLPGGTAWKAFLPNGYHSTSGRAALLVIDLKTGTIDKTITVGNAGSNGLGGLRLIRNAKKEVIAAYAGDLDGKLWRFEFDGESPASWRVGYNGNPLFVASGSGGAVQPITAAPNVVPHPNGDGSNVVIVGTGKLIDEGDRDVDTPQSIYGVWDKIAPGTSTATLSSDAYTAGTSLRSTKLIRQTISLGSAVNTAGERGATISTQYYNVTANEVSWTGGKLGWYMDVSDIETGVRTIYQPVVVDNFVLLSTVVPADNVAGCGAVTTGRAYDFFVHGATGAQDAQPVLDTNRDRDFNGADLTSSGYARPADGRDTVIREPSSGSASGRLSIQHAEGDMYARLPPVPPPAGISGRVWKQIINHPQSRP